MVRINKYIIPEKIINKMNDYIEKTHTDGRERGFKLCGNDKKRFLQELNVLELHVT